MEQRKARPTHVAHPLLGHEHSRGRGRGVVGDGLRLVLAARRRRVHVQLLRLVDIPHAHRAVVAAGGDDAPLRRGDHRIHALRVTFEVVEVDRSRRADAPLFDDAVVRSREQLLQAGAVAEPLDVAAVQLRKLEQQLAGDGGPDEHVMLVRTEDAIVVLVGRQMLRAVGESQSERKREKEGGRRYRDSERVRERERARRRRTTEPHRSQHRSLLHAGPPSPSPSPPPPQLAPHRLARRRWRSDVVITHASRTKHATHARRACVRRGTHLDPLEVGLY